EMVLERRFESGVDLVQVAQQRAVSAPIDAPAHERLHDAAALAAALQLARLDLEPGSQSKTAGLCLSVCRAGCEIRGQCRSCRADGASKGGWFATFLNRAQFTGTLAASRVHFRLWRAGTRRGESPVGHAAAAPMAHLAAPAPCSRRRMVNKVFE